jgi:hypothetical protein
MLVSACLIFFLGARGKRSNHMPSFIPPPHNNGERSREVEKLRRENQNLKIQTADLTADLEATRARNASLEMLWSHWRDRYLLESKQNKALSGRIVVLEARLRLLPIERGYDDGIKR